MGELKLESRPLRDDPAFIVRMVRNYLAGETQSPERLAEASALRRMQAERDVSTHLSILQRIQFRLILGLARRSIGAREDMRLARTQLFGAHRDIYRAIGRKFHTAGTLNRPDDIFYLTREEIRGYWEGSSASVNLASLANARRAEFARYELQDAPNRIVTTGAPYDALDALERCEPTAASISSDGLLRGLGCSAGIAEGRVRIVRSPGDDLELGGHILVAPRTDPGWAPLFPSARAIIVERGSLLSHSAVLARELGIPAVVGVAGIVDLLRDGELVRVDGMAGTIQLLERP
jgi:pyruvate,water dikinase